MKSYFKAMILQNSCRYTSVKLKQAKTKKEANIFLEMLIVLLQLPLFVLRDM